MNHLTLTDAEMKLALRFIIKGVKGSKNDVAVSEEAAASSLLDKALRKSGELVCA